MKSIRAREILVEKGLRVTPQRLAVLKAIINKKNHPTADKIVYSVKRSYPNISVGTVYKILDTFVEKNIICRVKTDSDIMRYDGFLDKHHHLYSNHSERIEDYYDEQLNRMIDSYFSKKKIPGFKIEDIRLQIIGKFLED